MNAVPVPDSLGGGEVRLYDLRKTALPDVVNTPPEAVLAEWQFWVVHFPSRRWAAVKGDRGQALAVMKKLSRGEDALGLCPPPKPAKKPRVHARACVREDGSGEEKKPPANRRAYTTVPEGADFDQAMDHVFPNQRLTQLWEDAVFATEEVTDKNGNVMGSKANWSARTTALNALTQLIKGRPREKEKKKAERPVLGIQELRQKLLISPEYRQAMLEMIQDCEKQAAALAGAVVKPAT